MAKRLPTSEVNDVLEAGEVERRHHVVSVQHPGRVHQTHKFQHLLGPSPQKWEFCVKTEQFPTFSCRDAPVDVLEELLVRDPKRLLVLVLALPVKRNRMP